MRPKGNTVPSARRNATVFAASLWSALSAIYITILGPIDQHVSAFSIRAPVLLTQSVFLGSFVSGVFLAVEGHRRDSFVASFVGAGVTVLAAMGLLSGAIALD